MLFRYFKRRGEATALMEHRSRFQRGQERRAMAYDKLPVTLLSSPSRLMEDSLPSGFCILHSAFLKPWRPLHHRAHAIDLATGSTAPTGKPGFVPQRG